MQSTEAARRESFAALFSQLAPSLYRTALGVLGCPHSASDALQDAGLKAFRYYDKLQRPEAAGAWMTRIVINACYDQGRRQSRLVPVGLEPLGEVSDDLPETDWELVGALQTLPDDQRTTVVLRFFQDLSIPQIATVMEVPEGTVKSRLHTALRKLRASLTRQGREGLR